MTIHLLVAQTVRPLKRAIGKPANAGGCAYKKHAREQLGVFAAELARGNVDYDFCIGGFEAGFRGYHCGRTFYRHRIGHASTVSASYNCRYRQTHEIMVRRHPGFFSDTARRERFLGLGYRRAALANRAAGNRKEAARLAWHAFRHGFSQDHELRNALREGYLPSWINRGLLGLWRLQKRLRLKAQTNL